MPERIGKYEIRGELGQGGFGKVYLAHDATVRRDVAIKVVTAVNTPELLKRFQREAATAGSLNHQNIVRIYDFGEVDGSPYLVMELVEGESLQTIIRAKKEMSLLDRVQVMEQVAAGLEAAHRAGIVHRDIKPSNIMVTPDGTAKITDFGTALKLDGAEERHTQAGSLLGTPLYLSPEQLEDKFDQRSDIWSFGVVFYELLSGVNPFKAESVPATMYKITQVPAPPLRSVAPECGEVLEGVVQRCLEIDREKRYQSVDDIRLDLVVVLEDLRRRRAAELLGRARQEEQGQRLELAMAKAREALGHDPTNAGARELLDRIRSQIRGQMIQEGPKDEEIETLRKALEQRVQETSRRQRQEAPEPEATVIFQVPKAGPQDSITSPPATPAPSDATRLLLLNRAGAKGYLIVTASADALTVGRRFELSGERFVIGRSSSADLMIATDPGLSRQHVAVERVGNKYTIRDLGSKNGSYLNGLRLSGEPQALLPGSQIRLSGSTMLTFSSDSLAEMPDLTGQTIDGRFRLTRRIRSSGKAALYEAEDTRLPRSVAIKILSPTLTDYPGYAEQFTREAETAARLRHPHICKVLDYGTAAVEFGKPGTVSTNYVAMELMEGGSLATRLAEEKRVSLEAVTGWLDQLTSALEYAHGKGVAHSGLKPTSIVFDLQDKAYVTDFALANRVGESRKEPVLGAPDFMAPEQWEGQEATPKTDQYSLAALVYLMLTGSRPYDGQLDPEVRSRNFAAGITPAHERAARAGEAGLPATISPVLARALSVAADKRYDSIRDFYEQFQKAREAAPVERKGPPRVFISYRRDSSAGWAVLFARELRDKYNISAFVDTLRADAAVRVPVKVQQAIKECDYFVCLLAKNTLRSTWVREEIRLAWEGGKPMIPVFQEGFVPPDPAESVEPHVQALVSYECVHLLDRLNIHVDHTIADVARMISRSNAAGA